MLPPPPPAARPYASEVSFQTFSGMYPSAEALLALFEEAQ